MKTIELWSWASPSQQSSSRWLQCSCTNYQKSTREWLSIIYTLGYPRLAWFEFLINARLNFASICHDFSSTASVVGSSPECHRSLALPAFVNFAINSKLFSTSRAHSFFFSISTSTSKSKRNCLFVLLFSIWARQKVQKTNPRQRTRWKGKTLSDMHIKFRC